MNKLKEMMVGAFTGLGAEVDWNDSKVRPEVAVSVAIGVVEEFRDTGKDLARVRMEVAGAKYSYDGYIRTDEVVAKLIQKAMEDKTPIALRFEKKRKKDVDPTLPIAEISATVDIARENIIKVVVGAYNVNSEEWVLTGEAQTDVNEDPSFVVAKIKSAVNQDVSDFFAASKKKLQHYGDDKANHLISMYYAVREKEAESDGELSLNMKQRVFLAEALLSAVDKLQMIVYNSDEPNYRDYSHTRARFMLFQWLNLNPLTKDAIKGLNEFLSQFINENAQIWKWALSKTEAPVDPEADK